MRCEDYPCCGHTDGLPCDWTYTPEQRAHDIEHAYCDHEAGICETLHDQWDESEEYECPDCGLDPDECGCSEPEWHNGHEQEDQWLDGSWEE